MVKVKKLTVTVKYSVGYGNVEIPDDVYKELILAANNGDEIDTTNWDKYSLASDWLTHNVRERDCMDWTCEIDDITDI